MRKVAIVSAMDEETSFIHEYLADRNNWKQIKDNTYENKQINTIVYVKVLGVGKVNAAFQTADVINEFEPNLIVNIGVSGGLAKEAKRGTIAIGKSYVQTDFRPYLEANLAKINESSDEIVAGLERVAEEKGYNYLTGKLATGDFFLNDLEERNIIIKEFNPISFDMETAAIAQVATAKDVEFAAIRIFSDLADDHALDNFKNREISEEERELQKRLQKQPTKLIINYLENIA